VTKPPGDNDAKTRRVYSGKIVKVDVDTVQLPNGNTVDLEMIRHPGAAAIVPFLTDPAGDDPQILLIKQYRHAAGAFIYEIPAGKLDGDESPEDCARRELREETGCTAGTLQHVYTFYTTPGFTDERIHAYMATDLVRGPTDHQRDEVMSLETVTLSRALELIKTGELKDAKTALTILYVAGFRLGR
jgi:ADP-ribose pyrophosphatase